MAKRFGYPAAFVMAVSALGAAAIAGRFVFPAYTEAVEAPVEQLCETNS
jgi:hypothetical protein